MHSHGLESCTINFAYNDTRRGIKKVSLFAKLIILYYSGMGLCSGHGNSVVIRELSLYPQSLLAKLTVGPLQTGRCPLSVPIGMYCQKQGLRFENKASQPAMTTDSAGMTTGPAGMTMGPAGMTMGPAGMTMGPAGMNSDAATYSGGQTSVLAKIAQFKNMQRTVASTTRTCHGSCSNPGKK